MAYFRSFFNPNKNACFVIFSPGIPYSNLSRFKNYIFFSFFYITSIYFSFLVVAFTNRSGWNYWEKFRLEWMPLRANRGEEGTKGVDSLLGLLIRAPTWIGNWICYETPSKERNRYGKSHYVSVLATSVSSSFHCFLNFFLFPFVSVRLVFQSFGPSLLSASSTVYCPLRVFHPCPRNMSIIPLEYFYADNGFFLSLSFDETLQ